MRVWRNEITINKDLTSIKKIKFDIQTIQLIRLKKTKKFEIRCKHKQQM